MRVAAAAARLPQVGVKKRARLTEIKELVEILFENFKDCVSPPLPRRSNDERGSISLG